MDHAWITCGSRALGPLGQSIRSPVARLRRLTTARTHVCTLSPFVGGAAIDHMRSHVFSPRSCWMPGPVAQGPRRCPPGSLPIFLFPTCLFRCSCRMHVLRLHNRHAHARVHAGVTAHGPPHVHAWWREWLPRVRRCLCARRCLRAHGGTCRQARDMTAEGQRFLDGRRACIRRITSQSDQTGK